jgi:hypothetical protein
MFFRGKIASGGYKKAPFSGVFSTCEFKKALYLKRNFPRGRSFPFGTLCAD